MTSLYTLQPLRPSFTPPNPSSILLSNNISHQTSTYCCLSTAPFIIHIFTIIDLKLVVILKFPAKIFSIALCDVAAPGPGDPGDTLLAASTCDGRLWEISLNNILLVSSSSLNHSSTSNNHSSIEFNIFQDMPLDTHVNHMATHYNTETCKARIDSSFSRFCPVKLTNVKPKQHYVVSLSTPLSLIAIPSPTHPHILMYRQCSCMTSPSPKISSPHVLPFPTKKYQLYWKVFNNDCYDSNDGHTTVCVTSARVFSSQYSIFSSLSHPHLHEHLSPLFPTALSVACDISFYVIMGHHDGRVIVTHVAASGVISPPLLLYKTNEPVVGICVVSQPSPPSSIDRHLSSLNPLNTIVIVGRQGSIIILPTLSQGLTAMKPQRRRLPFAGITQCLSHSHESCIIIANSMVYIVHLFPCTPAESGESQVVRRRVDMNDRNEETITTHVIPLTCVINDQRCGGIYCLARLDDMRYVVLSLAGTLYDLHQPCPPSQTPKVLYGLLRSPMGINTKTIEKLFKLWIHNLHLIHQYSTTQLRRLLLLDQQLSTAYNSLLLIKLLDSSKMSALSLKRLGIEGKLHVQVTPIYQSSMSSASATPSQCQLIITNNTNLDFNSDVWNLSVCMCVDDTTVSSTNGTILSSVLDYTHPSNNNINSNKGNDNDSILTTRRERGISHSHSECVGFPSHLAANGGTFITMFCIPRHYHSSHPPTLLLPCIITVVLCCRTDGGDGGTLSSVTSSHHAVSLPLSTHRLDALSFIPIGSEVEEEPITKHRHDMGSDTCSIPFVYHHPSSTSHHSQQRERRIESDEWITWLRSNAASTNPRSFSYSRLDGMSIHIKILEKDNGTSEDSDIYIDYGIIVAPAHCLPIIREAMCHRLQRMNAGCDRASTLSPLFKKRVINRLGPLRTLVTTIRECSRMAQRQMDEFCYTLDLLSHPSSNLTSNCDANDTSNSDNLKNDVEKFQQNFISYRLDLIRLYSTFRRQTYAFVTNTTATNAKVK